MGIAFDFDSIVRTIVVQSAFSVFKIISVEGQEERVKGRDGQREIDR